MHYNGFSKQEARGSVWRKVPNQAESAAVRVAVVGAGYWGPNIIRNLQENQDCELVAVCDRDTQKLGLMGKRFKNALKLVSDFDQLLNDETLDAIAIVTEINSHYPLVKAALEAGKHVFVEKPLATTPEQCAELGKLAETMQKTLMVGHTFIYNPAVRELKRIAQSGALGDIYYMHAQRLNLGRIQTTINSLWSLAVHDVSIALYLFDERPTWVRAWGNDFITPGVADVSFLNIQFPSGRLANIHTSWLDPEKKRQVTLVGSKQMAIYDDVSLDRKITLFDKGIEKVLVDSPMAEYKDFSEFQLLTRTGDVSIPHLNFTEPLKVEMQHFMDCIQGKIKTPLTSWREGYAVVKVLEAAQRSLDFSGIPVELTWEESEAHVSA
jgi:predicted dehydrogenase